MHTERHNIVRGFNIGIDQRATIETQIFRLSRGGDPVGVRVVSSWPASKHALGMLDKVSGVPSRKPSRNLWTAVRSSDNIISPGSSGGVFAFIHIGPASRRAIHRGCTIRLVLFSGRKTESMGRRPCSFRVGAYYYGRNYSSVQDRARYRCTPVHGCRGMHIFNWPFPVIE